jgi:hypothetical protein
MDDRKRRLRQQSTASLYVLAMFRGSRQRSCLVDVGRQVRRDVCPCAKGFTPTYEGLLALWWLFRGSRPGRQRKVGWRGPDSASPNWAGAVEGSAFEGHSLAAGRRDGEMAFGGCGAIDWPSVASEDPRHERPNPYPFPLTGPPKAVRPTARHAASI